MVIGLVRDVRIFVLKEDSRRMRAKLRRDYPNRKITEFVPLSNYLN